VPSRYRTIRPSTSRLRCIRKISPLRRFSNVTKLSTIHAHLWPMSSDKKFLRILSLSTLIGSKPFAESMWQFIILVYSPFRSWQPEVAHTSSISASSARSVHDPTGQGQRVTHIKSMVRA